MADYGQVAFEAFATLVESEGEEMPGWGELTPVQRRVWSRFEERVLTAAEYWATAEEVETGRARKMVEEVLHGRQ